MPSKRRYDRLWAQVSAQGRRLGAQFQQLFSGRIDDEAERRATQLAEAESIANSAGELRAGVAKVAQLRAYIQGTGGLGPEAQAALTQLWDHLPGDEPQAILRVVREELGADPATLFSRFDTVPLAAASLGQVHAATLPDGQDVAVKVQYPGVAEALRDDLATRGVLRQLVGADLGDALPDESIAALRERLLAELDYKAEAASLQRFRRAFRGDPTVVIPAVLPQLSAGRVLTMERLFGRSLPTLFATGTPTERAAVAATIFRFAFNAPWRHHIINLDPNPGNYLILDSEKDRAAEQPSRVGFLDFGCTAELPESIVTADRQLFLAMIHRDGEELRYAAHQAGLVSSRKAITFDTSNYRSWEQTLAGPFMSREPTLLDAAWARELTDLTWRLVQSGKMALPPPALLLWRQRLGVLAVLANLRPRLPMRRLLADLLDDGENPVPLYDRYR